MILEQLPEVQALPSGQKWQLLDELWQELRTELEAAPLSEEQARVLEERSQQYLAHPGDVRTWEQVQARLAEHKARWKSSS
jgi:putative addiction module component (TIGR02574 family)